MSKKNQDSSIDIMCPKFFFFNVWKDVLVGRSTLQKLKNSSLAAWLLLLMADTCKLWEMFTVQVCQLMGKH